MIRRTASLLVAVAAVAFGCSTIVTPSLEASADRTTLSPGQKAQLTVVRHFEGGPFDNVTNRVELTVEPKSLLTITLSDNGQVAQITPASDTGVATVTVTEKDDTAYTTIRFTVTAATVTALAINPSAATIVAPSQTSAFTATATLSDLTTQDVTKNVSWSSSNAAVATVGNSATVFGLVTGVSQGDATVTASYALPTGGTTTASAPVFVRSAASDAGTDSGL